MSSAPSGQPTFLSVAPRFVVQDLERALAFYEQLGFQTTYHDEAFAIVERDGIDLHLNSSPDGPKRHSVCWIAVTNIDALYQQYLPTNAVQSVPHAQPWGLKEFFEHETERRVLLEGAGLLLLTGMHRLKERGVRSVFLETEQAETPALHLFTSAGFHRVSAWHWMTKEIAPLT